VSDFSRLDLTTMRLRTLCIVALACGLIVPAMTCAQEAPKPGPKKTRPAAKKKSLSAVGGQIRKLAEGVETTIKPDRVVGEVFETHDPTLGTKSTSRDPAANHKVVEILRGSTTPLIRHGAPGLAWRPFHYGATSTLRHAMSNVQYRRRIWHLEFTFKPLRMMWVDIPQPNGKMARKMVWYMVYRVKNTGNHLEPLQSKEDTAQSPIKWKTTDQAFRAGYKVKKVDATVWFTPVFVLKSEEFDKAYVDRVIPIAIKPIQNREDKRRKLLDTVSISSRKIPLSKGRQDNSVWGVATWTDVDPKMDRFSIYIQGLTNAYRWRDRDKTVAPLLQSKLDLTYQKGRPLDTKRDFFRKTLRLRFWRPGDRFYAHEEEIRFGASPIHDKEKPDYEWVWRRT